jgi:hypothetical protein
LYSNPSRRIQERKSGEREEIFKDLAYYITICSGNVKEIRMFKQPVLGMLQQYIPSYNKEYKQPEKISQLEHDSLFTKITSANGIY